MLPSPPVWSHLRGQRRGPLTRRTSACSARSLGACPEAQPRRETLAGPDFLPVVCWPPHPLSGAALPWGWVALPVGGFRGLKQGVELERRGHKHRGRLWCPGVTWRNWEGLRWAGFGTGTSHARQSPHERHSLVAWSLAAPSLAAQRCFDLV